MLEIIREGRAKKEGTVYLGPYARVSTDQRDQRNSLVSQRSYFMDIIGRTPGLELYSEYFDEGISGTSLKKRAAFNRMIEDARAGRLDVIVTKEVSRFARNTVDALSLTRELKQLGVQVIFLSDGINTFDRDGELRLTIMASLAQEESRKTSDRVKWGQTRRMEQGVVFGRSMLGYDVRDGKLSINPEGAKTVRLIFQKYLYEGMGAFRIARYLEETGIPNYRGSGSWTPKVIYAILRNEKYVGDLEQKKTYTPDFLSHQKKYNDSAEAKVFIQNHHEGIISRALWDAVQAEIQRRSGLATQERRGKHSSRYWCSGKLLCAECGSRLVRRVRRLKNGRERRSWYCGKAARFGTKKQDSCNGSTGCSTGTVNEQVLKYCIWYCIQQVQIPKEQITQEILAEVSTVLQEQSPEDIVQLEKELRRQEEKTMRAVELRIAGEISAGELELIREAGERETAKLREKLQKAQKTEREQAQQVGQGGDFARIVREILEGGDSMADGNETFLGEMLEQVLVCQKNKVEVKLRAVPFSFRLWYITSGKGESYTVKVNRQEWV